MHCLGWVAVSSGWLRRYWLILIDNARTNFTVLRDRLAYPRPYPNTPYNRASSKRLWGDIPDLLRVLTTTQDPSKFTFEQCGNLNSPVVQLLLRPFLKPTIFISDVLEVKTIRPILPHCSLAKATTPEFKGRRRLWEGSMGTSFLRRVAAPKMHRVALELVELLKTKSAIPSHAGVLQSLSIRRNTVLRA